MIYNDVTRAVGGTPLIHLNRVARLHRVAGTGGVSGTSSGDAPGATILGKLESANPANSVKDRLGVAIVDAAEASGALRPGGTIIEATSGNTGIALAMVGAARGYHVVITMPDAMSAERRAVVRAFGAELVLTPAAEGMRGAVASAEQIARERGGVLASQFTNAANPAIHHATTGPEIWNDVGDDLAALVACIGTGGTISGAGRYLKEQAAGTAVIGVEPAESPLLTEGTAGPHGIQGIGANFVPTVYDASVVDEVTTVTTDMALATARELAATEGILCGISSGAAVAAALGLSTRPEFSGRTIVAILPDFGERYLSTPLFAGLMDS